MFVRKHDILIPVLFKLHWCNNNHFPKPVKEAGFTCSCVIAHHLPHSHVNSFRSVSAGQRSALTVY